MALCIFGDNYPATGRAPYADRCWGHTPEERDSFPVIVTYTLTHVVWVPADSQADAVEQVDNEPYEYTNDQRTLAEADSKSAAPDEWDWEIVSRDGYFGAYEGLTCDAHVKAYRTHLHTLARTAEAVLAS